MAVTAGTARTGTAPAAAVRLRRTAWRHPEWWSLTLSAGAWVLLAAGAPSGHARHGAAWATAVWHWLLMVVAMMLPLAVAPVRVAAARSLWARRHRAVLGFLVGYMVTWVGVGIVATGLLAAAPPVLHRGLVAGAVFAAAALWRLTPAWRRAQAGCHRTMPLHPRGWRADRDCLRYGWAIAVPCLGSCWAGMLGCLLAGHALPLMAGAAVAAGLDRYAAPREQAMVGPLLLALAVFAAFA